MVNQQRLWKRLMELSKIGENDSGGITRFSFTEEYRQAQDLVVRFMEEAGLTVTEDGIGNLLGRREGTNPNSATVLIGSHIDTVYNGGAFDGALGVIAAIEVMETLKEQGIELAHSVEVGAFTDEEGGRFSSGMLGSRALSGGFKQEFLKLKDSEGIAMYEAIKDYGYDPEKIPEAMEKESEDLKAYLEIHVEQGKVLENADASVGIVSGIAGPLWLKFRLTGVAGHAGTTPMDKRSDALVAASKIIQDIECQAKQTSSTVGTVGKLDLQPGGVNIIPEQVEFTLDLRDVKKSARDQVEEAIVKNAEQVCKERAINLEIAELQRIPPVECDEDLKQAIETAIKDRGQTKVEMATGAAHDANQISRLCPVGMIFVRSKDGISHAPQEWSDSEDCAEGAEVLYQTILQVAGGK